MSNIMRKISIKLRENGIVNGRYVIYKPKNTFIKILGGIFFTYNEPVLYVGEGQRFSEIQDAVNFAKDTPKYPVTIKVKKGIYSRVHVGGNRNISIIGENKDECIIRDDSGQYSLAPLEIEGNCLVSDLTVISTHDNDKVTNVDKLRSYAVHADFPGEGISEFRNCKFISYQNAAFGCGLHKNQTVKIIGCEMYSHTPVESSMTKNGALFCHNCMDLNTDNQYLIVDNSIIKSDNSYAVYINDSNKEIGIKNVSKMDVTFINNKIFGKEDDYGSLINKEEPNDESCYSGQITLNEDSCYNNIEELNY